MKLKNERHKNIVFLGKLVRQMTDDNIPYSYKKFLYLFLTRTNSYFLSVCNNIGIDATVWRAKYKQLFSDMFI